MKNFTPLKPSDMQLRDWNPVRGLTIPGLVAAEELAQRGDMVELQWLYRKIERKYAALRGAKKRLSAAVLKLDWDIRIPADLDGDRLALAERQKKVLREAYDRIGNLREATKFMVGAEFRGFAHLERHYEKIDGRWQVVRLEPVSQWHWQRDGIYGEWRYNARATMASRGEAVDLERGFIVREVEDPINEIAAKCFVLRNFAQKDRANFVERFGTPFIYWILSEGIAQSLVNDGNKLAEWQELLSRVTGDGEGIFPGGQLETLQGGSGTSSQPFEEFEASLDAETVLAATSGKLTMLNEPTGIGSGNAEAHSQAFDELGQALAGEISETFQEQFDRPLLAERFPDDPPLAYFELAAQDQDDVAQLVDHARDLAGTPYALEPSDFAERTGYQLAEQEQGEADKPQFRRGAQRNRAETPTAAAVDEEAEFDAAARDDAGRALSQDLAPIRAILERLLDSADDDLALEAATALEQIEAEGERLVLSGGTLGTAFQNALMSAVANGAEETTSQNPTQDEGRE